MSYCPDCKYNFIDEINVCPDCKKELVDKIPEKHEVKVEWISLIKVTSSVMADMLKGTMEENEIVCLEKSDLFHSAFATEATSIAGGQAEIFVPSDKIEKAKSILEQLNARFGE